MKMEQRDMAQCCAKLLSLDDMIAWKEEEDKQLFDALNCD